MLFLALLLFQYFTDDDWHKCQSVSFVSLYASDQVKNYKLILRNECEL